MGAGQCVVTRWGGSWDDADLLIDLAEAGVTREMLATAYQHKLVRRLAAEARLTPGQLRMAALAWDLVQESSSGRQGDAQSDELGDSGRVGRGDGDNTAGG